MFPTALPILPPPSTSLLPPLYTPHSTDQTHHGAGSLQHTHPHQHHHHHHHHQRRSKHGHPHTRSAIQLLSLDERTISQRKMAIAMYGYSWLKPAGCSKTMLGRREEELEREEVERQLREVELQERAAAEGEAEAEAERLAEMRRLEMEAEAGGGRRAGRADRDGEGGLGLGERDLDDDIPEADEDGVDDDGEVESHDGTHEEDEDMEGDLDDDIPDADDDAEADTDPEEDVESSWVYDTTRDADTESEGHRQGLATGRPQARRGLSAGVNPPALFGRAANEVQTEEVVSTMLDEDELGEMELQRDLDDDVPDMDAEDMDIDMDMDEQERDLDDEVPEAEDEEEWQHTDTELEASDMDISILPTDRGQKVHGTAPDSARSRRSDRSSSSIGPGTTHEEMRRSSGNMMMPPPLPVTSSSRRQQGARAGWIRSQRDHATAAITPQGRAQYHTPGMDTGDSVSNLISTGGSSAILSSAEPDNHNSANNETDTGGMQTRGGRGWLNATGARRNLFGGFGRVTTTTTNSSSSIPATTDGSGFTPEGPSNRQQPQQPRQNQSQNQRQTSRQTQQRQPTLAQVSTGSNSSFGVTGISSGGLFTPSPHAANSSIPNPRATRAVRGQFNTSGEGGEEQEQEQQQEGEEEEEAPRSRTRSGRLLNTRIGMSGTIGRRTGRREGGGGGGGRGEGGG